MPDSVLVDIYINALVNFKTVSKSKAHAHNLMLELQSYKCSGSTECEFYKNYELNSLYKFLNNKEHKAQNSSLSSSTAVAPSKAPISTIDEYMQLMTSSWKKYERALRDRDKAVIQQIDTTFHTYMDMFWNLTSVSGGENMIAELKTYNCTSIEWCNLFKHRAINEYNSALVFFNHKYNVSNYTIDDYIQSMTTRFYRKDALQWQIAMFDKYMKMFHDVASTSGGENMKAGLKTYNCTGINKCGWYIHQALNVFKDVVNDKYRRIRVTLLKVTTPIMMCIGTVGNLLSAVVLLRRSFRKTTMSFYLMCLAATDTMILYMVVLPKWLMEYGVFLDSYSSFTCKLAMFLSFFLPHLDSWLIVNLTLERLVAVMFPFKCRDWFTKSRAAVYLLITVFVLFCINEHFFWTFTLQPAGTVCYLFPHYKYFYLFIWTWISMCVFSIIPSLIMIILNTCICVRLFASHSMHSTSNQAHEQSLMRLKRTVGVLLVVCIVFIVSSLPGSIWQIIIYHKYDSDQWAKVITQSLGLLHLINNSFNFVLYCLAGSKFRQELITMFSEMRQCCCR